ELTRELGGNRRRDQLTSGRQIVEALEQFVQPLRDGGAAALRETAGGRDVRDRQDSGHDLDVDAGRRGFVAEAEEAVGREEKLCDGPRGTGRAFAPEVIEIEPAIERVRMNLGVSGDRNVEWRNGLEAANQV